ncbi:helix-turn-helix domain-containing protein [Streptosporangium sp. KLBMP 9127]|nr:helix-turn-helix transcriptional regulator [Streptosporangium sp. KLBMP 9127]
MAETTGRARTPIERFGAELLKYRKDAGLSQTRLGDRLLRSASLVSGIERGIRTPQPDFAEAVDQTFGLTDRHFARLAERIHQSPGGPRWYARWVEEIEPAATVLRSWDPLLVPGLLQTEAYARAVFSQAPRITPQGVEERVQARLLRQHILERRDPPCFMVLIDAGVLRRKVGGAEVMRDQLDYLINVASRPAMSLQVVDPECLTGLMGPFMIAELPDAPDTVHIESSAEGRISTDSDTVSSLWRRYDAIRSWAYPDRASLEMIKEVRQEWT